MVKALQSVCIVTKPKTKRTSKFNVNSKFQSYHIKFGINFKNIMYMFYCHCLHFTKMLLKIITHKMCNVNPVTFNILRLNVTELNISAKYL